MIKKIKALIQMNIELYEEWFNIEPTDEYPIPTAFTTGWLLIMVALVIYCVISIILF